jgi:hypothetical protein
MNDREIQELRDKVTRMSNNMADIDFWLRASKYSGITLIVLATFAGGVIVFLLSLSTKIQGADQTLTGFEKRYSDLAGKLDTLDDKATSLQFHRMDAALLARTRNLGSIQQPNTYTLQDYSSDLQQLASLGQEYLYRLSENPGWDGANEINRALQEAAGRVGRRATLGLPRFDEQKYLAGHEAAPGNFVGILAKIQQDRSRWNSEYLMCYQDEIPVWLDTVGVFGDNGATSKSAHCQRLLQLPDCDKNICANATP